MYYTTPEVYEFISKQTNDPILKWKTCRISGTKFPIFNSDLLFYKRISPKFRDNHTLKDVVMQIPTPTLCPEERQRRRLLFRNERNLYKRKCDATGEDIISIYSPEKTYKVYNYDYRRSDKRDPMCFGTNFDFSKTFNEQFLLLSKEVPLIPLFATENENSAYVNGAEKNKNCYLIFVSDHNERCLYSDGLVYSDNSIDCLSGYELSKCFDTIGCKKCFNSRHIHYCENVSNSMYCINSSFLDNCLFCWNLNNKKYYIFNKQYTKEEYEKEKNIILKKGKTQKKAFFDKILAKTKKLNINGKNNQNVFGNNIYESKSGSFVFDCFESENGKYGSYMNKNKDCQDSYVLADNCQLCNESVSSISNYKSSFTYSCWHNNKNIYYCQYCSNCENCFGCIGLRKKQYCIFNKQYTKEEYEKLAPQIIKHMMKTGERGEFFDPSLSPFGYNETVAQEYFPMTRDEKKDYFKKVSHFSGEEELKDFWQDKRYDPVIPEHVQTLKGNQIPDDITTVTDDILKKILVCEISGRPFRIIKQELEFYRKHNLPIPRKHPDIRHEERLKKRPPRELHLRNCDKCGVEMISVYPKIELSKNGNMGEVYCEGCYQKEVFS